MREHEGPFYVEWDDNVIYWVRTKQDGEWISYKAFELEKADREHVIKNLEFQIHSLKIPIVVMK